MALPQINGSDVLGIEGELQDLGQMPEETTRDGADGHAYDLVGERADDTRLVVHATGADTATLQTLLADWKDLQGTLITIKDANQITHTSVLVIKVVKRFLGPLLAASNGGAYKLETVWLVKKQA